MHVQTAVCPVMFVRTRVNTFGQNDMTQSLRPQAKRGIPTVGTPSNSARTDILLHFIQAGYGTLPAFYPIDTETFFSKGKAGTV